MLDALSRSASDISAVRVSTKPIPGPRFNLAPGSIANIDGQECLVERRLRDAWHFLAIKTNEPCHLTDSEIAEKQAHGNFFIAWQPGDRRSVEESQPLSPLNIGEGAHKENLRRLEYVKACVTDPDFCRSRRVLDPIALRVANEHGEKKPAFQSLLNWIGKYDRHFATFGPACFADRNDRKGNYGDRLPEYQERAIKVGIDYWLKRQSKSNAYASVHAFVRKYDVQCTDKSVVDARFLDEDGHLKPPSKRTFERRCDRVSPAVRDAMRVGTAYAKQRYRTYTTTALPERPYSHVEVDHCTLDIQLVYPGGTILGRPDLVVFRDRATSMIVGYGLGFEEPSYSSFLSGLRHAMYPKDMRRFPAVSNGYPCYGRIENLYHDNAFHFIGDNIAEAARNLGINLVRLQPREPWLKGALEQFFNDLNLGLVHRLGGTTLGNVVVRRDHEHLGEAALSTEQFEHILNFWICDVYNAGSRRALGHIRSYGGKSPLQAWSEKLRDYTTDALPKPEVFIALAGDVSYRTIQKNGITVDHIIYENPNLASLLGNPKHKRRNAFGEATKYKIIRDPNDLGAIRVFDHNTGSMLLVPATTAHLSYARGLTLTEHGIICANVQRRQRELNKLPMEALMKAKATLNEIADKITNGPKFKTVQRTLARWLEGDRIRQLRSEVQSFAPEGRDYLSSVPPPRSTGLVSPIQKSSAPPVANADANLRSESEEQDRKEMRSDGFADDDLADLRAKKNWSSEYD